MGAREKAVEAAAEPWPVGPEPDWLEKACEHAEDRLKRAGWHPNDFGHAVELSLTAAAPIIESALLDRIEEEIGKLVHEPNRDENGDQSYGYGLGLNAALAVLSQIRQEGKP